MEFKHPLPSMETGTYNNMEGGFPCFHTAYSCDSGNLDAKVDSSPTKELGGLILDLRHCIMNERRLFVIDGRVIMLCINWIRDHVHMMKAFMHWEYDLKSFISLIMDYQDESGFFYELIKQTDDPHHTFVRPDCVKYFPEDNYAMTRLEIEADVEYLVVEGAYLVHQATGDDEWLRHYLPKLEKAIDYMTSAPKRWDPERGLVIRPATIDTWDFKYNEPNTDRIIYDNQKMYAMHGDSSGVYMAMLRLAYMNRYFGNEAKAAEWEARAAVLRANLIKYCWNGRFFAHMVPVNGEPVDEHENERLSLSNTYDMNRGVTDFEQSRSIIEEYMARRRTSPAFAEFFSIDPPYENFCGRKPGFYVNGGITPFTAGELALAAFEHGYEAYGWDIIQRLAQLMHRDGALYFLYHPDDSSSQGGGPSGWGAAALMNAIEKGLAGVTDTGVCFNRIHFTPRWPVTHYRELRYITGYEVSHVLVDIHWMMTDEGILSTIAAPASEIDCDFLLPEGAHCRKLLLDGSEAAFTEHKVADSVYVHFDITSEVKKTHRMEILF